MIAAIYREKASTYWIDQLALNPVSNTQVNGTLKQKMHPKDPQVGKRYQKEIQGINKYLQ